MRHVRFVIILLALFSIIEQNFSDTKVANTNTPDIKETSTTKKTILPEDTETKLPESISIDDQLQIFFPKIKKQEEFFFQPYTQEFMNKSEKFIQIILPEIEKVLPKLSRQKHGLRHNLHTIIKFSHYYYLLYYHKIFRVGTKNLEIIERFCEPFIAELLLEIQTEPAENLRQFRNILMHDYLFHDVYALQKVYDRILYHINRPLNGEDDYEWCKIQFHNWKNSDAAWIYMNYLDKEPENIFQAMQDCLQELLYDKIDYLVQIPSKTYLRQARELYSCLKLLDMDKVIINNLSSRIELANLRFQSYEEGAKYYEEMMEMFAKLPGAKTSFPDEKDKALIFLPFFDQLTEYAEKKFQRGKFSCQSAMSVNEEQCSLHWREANRLFSFIVEFSPFRTLSLEALERLKTIYNTNRSPQEFISKARLFELSNHINKPHL